ncbi:MAG: hypothetical protein ACI8ZM_005686, partial [Crocinitomix sp.]
MPRVITFCFFLINILNASAQSDCQAVIYDMMRKSDSLVELKQFELARDHQNTAKHISEDCLFTQEQGSGFYGEYSLKKAKVEYQIRYNLLDASRNKYRLDLIRKHIKSGYYPPLNYISDVAEYDISKPELIAIIDSLILILPTDTVVINYNNDGRFQLTTDHNRDLKVFTTDISHKSIGNANDLKWRQVKVFKLKDSMLFEGVTRQNTGEIISRNGEFMGIKESFVHFKNGSPYADTTVYYAKLYTDDLIDIIHKPILQTIPNKRGYAGAYYKSGFKCNFDNVIVNFYPNGDTSMYHSSDNDNH